MHTGGVVACTLVSIFPFDYVFRLHHSPFVVPLYDSSHTPPYLHMPTSLLLFSYQGKGNTPLHKASWSGHVAVVQYLVVTAKAEHVMVRAP